MKINKARNDAIVISKTGERTYAEMLKEIKTHPDLQELGENVNKIRRTAAGDLILLLNRKANASTDIFKENIQKALHGEANIKTLSEQKWLECRDMDETTTSEDLRDEIKKQFPEIGLISAEAIKSIRTMRDGTQSARLKLPAGVANILLKVGKLRIGWVQCKLREKLFPTRCFQCLDYGHVAIMCKSATNRSAECIRCGGKGHKVKECKATPKCSLCGPNSENGHPTGGRNCPVYKNALKTKLTRNV